MFVKIPILRELNDVAGIDAFCKSSCWEISVAQRDYSSPSSHGIYWSIVLSILIPAVHSGNGHLFNEFLKTVGKDADASEVRNRILWYNPFLNRHACFYNDVLKSVVKSTYDRATQFRKEYEKSKFERPPRGTGYWLDVIAHLLKCRITFISETSIEDEPCLPTSHESGIPEFFCGSDKSSEQPGGQSTDIVLYGKRTNSRWQLISFRLNHEIGEKLQKSAFEKILRMASIRENVEELLNLEGIRDNFIVTLIRNKRYFVLEKLFQHPTHVFDKLHEAGFTVDPVKKDENFRFEADITQQEFKPSAYFFAVETGRLSLLYMLHVYATNKTSSIECNVREPDSTLVENMIVIRSTLSEMNEFYETSGFVQSRNINSSVHLKELLEFHTFQYEVCRELMKSKTNPQYFDRLPRIIYTAEIMKDTVLSILNIYKKHFFMEPDVLLEPWSPLFHSYDTFKKYNNFFQNLDFTSALLFFDRSFSLKSKLQLDTAGAHEKMESGFLRFVFFSMYYYGSLNVRKRYGSGQAFNAGDTKFTLGPFKIRAECRNNLFLILVHLERIRFFRMLKNFTNLLAGVIVDKNNARENISPSEVYTLTSVPDIKEKFVVMRLNHYLDLAQNANLKKKFHVGRLVILRALQVLGETIKLEQPASATVIQSLLISCLPNALARDLYRVRDMLCHHSKKNVSARLDLKSNLDFFTELQKDLINIREPMKHILDLEATKFRLYLFESAKTSMGEWWIDQGECNNYRQLSVRLKDLGLIDSETILKAADNEQDRQLVDESAAKKQWEKCFEILSPDMDCLQDDIKRQLKTLISSYTHHFTSIFSCIKGLCSEKELKGTDSCNKVRYLFDCLNVLTEFIISRLQQDCHQTEQLLRNLEDISRERDVCCAKLMTLEKRSESSKFCESITEILGLLQRYQACLSKIPGYTDLPRTDKQYSDAFAHGCQHIHKFKLALGGHHFFSECRKKEIQFMIPDKYRNHYEARLKLIQFLKSDVNLSLEEKEKLFAQLLFNKKKLKALKDAYDKNDVSKLEKEKHSSDMFLDGLEDDQINIRVFDYACENFNFPGEVKEELTKIVLGRSQVVQDKSLEFFLDRIKTMKELLIDSNSHFKHLWNNVKSDKTKVYIRKKLAAMYAVQPELQACIEVLLFDCMNLMEGRKKNLEHIWLKANYLFNGINLRNILGHGNPLFEAAAKILDPSDLPNDIMTKVLELVTDVDALEAMHTLKNGGYEYFSDLLAFIKDDENACDDEERARLRKIIRDSDNWEDYLYLVPRRETWNNSKSSASDFTDSAEE